ncbi:unnamed protein product [Leuciscus chuanchicus]
MGGSESTGNITGSTINAPVNVHVCRSLPPTRVSNPELDTPWREFDWTLKEALKDNLENFTLDNPDVKDIKILVTGEVGAGKSSFILSINNAFQGRIISRALVNSPGGDTQELKGFSIKSGNKSLPFVFTDMMEKEPDAFAGSQTDDIINAVFRNVKDGYEFNAEQPLNLSDQGSCLVYIIAADTALFSDDKRIDQLTIIRKRISEAGIPQVVVMTKVDEACPLVNDDLRKIYTSKKIKEKMELCSDKLGLPLSHIFPVKNYHEEINTEDDIDVLILEAFQHIVQIANNNLEDSCSKK